MTLWDSLLSPAALAARECVVVGGAIVSKPRSDIAADGRRVAAGLNARGVRDGELVGCLLTNTPAVLAGVLGIWSAGGAIVSLPIIARGMSLAAYLDQLRALCKAASLRIVIAEHRVVEALVASLIRELGDNYGVYHEQLAAELRRWGGGPPDPSHYVGDFARYADDCSTYADIIRSESLLRRARDFRLTGRELNILPPGDDPPLVLDGQLVSVEMGGDPQLS